MLGNNVTYNNSFGIECNLKEIKIYKQKKKNMKNVYGIKCLWFWNVWITLYCIYWYGV